ncbi:MAG: flavodoxin [Chitinophagaceae bacterium]|nr:MAG: flavodoxin [Chitinophagaceae bacterium]
MKKNKTYWIWLCTAMMAFGSCSRAQSPVSVKPELLTNRKILIVYLSRTNNTRAIAEIIHKEVGGNMVPLELATPYPANYQTTVQQVARENASGFLPPLKTSIDSIDKYDVVFVGFPTWGMQLPPPVKSFLTKYKLTGKTVVPFNSNGGYGIGSTFETVEQLCPDNEVLKGYSTKGGSERDGKYLVIQGDKEKQVRLEVQAWLKESGFTN